MVVGQYRLNSNFRAPHKDTDSDGEVQYSTFKKGETIEGYYQERDKYSMELPLIDYVITVDGFTIPATRVDYLGEVNYSADGVAAPISNVPASTSAGIMTDIQSLSNNTYVQKLTTATNYSINGATLGAVVAGLYAVTKGKSIIFSVLIGAVIGGLVGKYVSKNVDITKYGLPKDALNASGSGKDKGHETLEQKKARLKHKKG